FPDLLLLVPHFRLSAPVIVLDIVNPAFRCFFHEHARKIGIWAWAFVISPYLGPFLSAIISNYKPWRTSFWIDFMIVGLALVFVTFLGTSPFFLDCSDPRMPRFQGPDTPLPLFRFPLPPPYHLLFTPHITSYVYFIILSHSL